MSKPKIFIAGHKGMVGSALVRILQNQEAQIITKDSKELNLLNQYEVLDTNDQFYLYLLKMFSF